MIPCITKQVEERLREKPEKVQAKKSSDVVHKGVKCQGCGASEIVGIRYKCSECHNFNLCEICENEIEHQHNLLKMKKEQVSKEKSPKSKGKRCEKKNLGWGKGWENKDWGKGWENKGWGWGKGWNWGSKQSEGEKPHSPEQPSSEVPPPPHNIRGFPFTQFPRFPPGFPFHEEKV